MGFFSWITQDTNKSIPNSFSKKKTFKVYMHDNKGNVWEEKDYEGYGEFGGKDFYVLLAEMNGLESDREKGIDLAFDKTKPCLFPNLTQNKKWKYTKHPPEDCGSQGYFY